MAGNLNPGLLICQCESWSGRPILGATVQLNFVEVDAAFGGRLKLFNPKGEEATSVTADTTRSGVAFLQFFWDPTHIGYFTSNTPKFRAVAYGVPGFSKEIVPGALYGTNEVSHGFETDRAAGRMGLCVNLGQIWSEGKGEFQFKENESIAIDIAKKIKEALEFHAKATGQKTPKVPFLKPMRPTPEMVSLLGYASFRLKAYD